MAPDYVHPPMAIHSYPCEECDRIASNPIWQAQAKREQELFNSDLPAWYRMNNPHRLDIQHMSDKEVLDHYREFFPQLLPKQYQ